MGVVDTILLLLQHFLLWDGIIIMGAIRNKEKILYGLFAQLITDSLAT